MMLFSTCVALSLLATGCGRASGNAREFFGRVEPPEDQVLRYVSGSEPESLDPQLSTGQSEARIYLALYEGLIEYHPVTSQPIPAIAETWDVNADGSEYIFHLRANARWTNGEPITAHDFVYSLRRGLSPELAARSANMAYYVKYAKGYNQKGAFVRDPQTKEFLLASAASEKTVALAPKASARHSSAVEAETAFHRFISGPPRLIVSANAATRGEAASQNPALKQLLDGKEFVPVAASDIGIEATDDYTLRITLTQPAPFFLGMMAHQFFRAVPRKVVEQHGIHWTRTENIVTSGPFRVQSWKPYDELVVVKNPLYWDAAQVRLNKIRFYPLDDETAMLNLYKAGAVDATFSHSVPTGWVDSLRPLKDYMDAPESAITFVMVNTKKIL
ncbi:MAG: peptide ABC transporter substrate-binding protein [Pyrinomonadaceae bacterium]